MNFNELQNLWNTGGNEPTSVQREKLARQFADKLRRQRRNQLIWLVWTFFVLTALTGFVGWLVFGTDKIYLAREWGLIPLLLIPWSAAGFFLKRFLKPAAPLCRGDVAIADALAAAATVNRAAQSRAKVLGIMYAVFIPALACAVWQLHSVGKTSSREMLSMTIFFATALCLGAGAVCARYRFRLVPQQKHLDALLRQF
jgi:hypothetical protein